MTAKPLRRPWGPAIAVSIAGLAVGGLTETPFALLVPMAALQLNAQGRAVAMLRATLAAALAAATLVVLFAASDISEAALSWMAFFAIALCIGELIAATTLPPLGADALQAMRIIEMMPAYTWSASADGHITYVSANTLSFTGQQPGNSGLFHLLDNAGWRHIIHPDDYQRVIDIRRHSLASGVAFDAEYRVRRRDGSYRWFRSFGALSHDNRGRVVGWYGTMIDIEEKKRAEQALQRSERKLQQLIDAVPALIWSTSPEGTPAYVNKRFTDITGASLEDITALDGSPSLSVVHPDDRAEAIQAASHAFRTGEAYLMRYRQVRRGGIYRWTETRAEPLRDETGAILQWYGVSVDIHDLVTVQEALRESESSLRQLVETLPAMIDCASPNGEPIYRSQQLREFLGYNLDDLDEAGKPRLEGTLDSSVHPEDIAGVKARYAHCLATGEPYARRHRLRRANGEYRWVETRAGPMRDMEGAIVQWNVICLDIEGEVRAREELRLAQERLAQASQAASLAELSASIAHEVNQPLAAVVANSHACQRWLTAEPPNTERALRTVERIIRDANGAADVVRRIRALFKRTEEIRTNTPLESVAAEVRDLMAEEAARRRISLDIAIEGRIPPVAIDRVQIQQVLSNIIRNGMESMETTADNRTIRIRVRQAADMLQIETSDSGPGVSLPDQVFQPFFTTKPNGMGMGLAICRSIIESHGGRLWVEPNKPSGAIFVFTLPIDPEATS